MIAVRGACIPESCADDIFAVSLPSVTPSAFVTWFQAQEASTVSALRAIAGK